jgi:hypothetical protein
MENQMAGGGISRYPAFLMFTTIIGICVIRVVRISAQVIV